MALETRKKDRPIGARISSELYEQIAEYITELDVSMGQFIRQSLKEYMWAHPLPPKPVTNHKPKKKGK